MTPAPIDASLPFTGPAPDRERWVTSQATRFKPQLWLAALPPEPRWWPTAIASNATRIDRGQIHTIGQASTQPDGAAQTFIAATIWGTGNRQVKLRTAACDLGIEAVGTRLAEAAQLLRTHGPAVAHAALSGGGRLHVAGIGPSFFTNFLYFAGYYQATEDARPLILDRNVERGIRKLYPSVTLDRHSTTDYESYLFLAHQWANSWDCQPDVMERVLFDIGKCSDLSVDVLFGRSPGSASRTLVADDVTSHRS